MENFGFIYAFIHAGVVGKIVFGLLFILSLYSWALIFKKYSTYKNLIREYEEISRLFTKRSLYDVKKYAENNYGIYSKFIDFVVESYKKGNKANNSEVRLQSEIILNQASNLVSKNLSNLATISNAAPFIGLFGTVLGVINSFQKIGITSSASLSVIAPGISEALYATAFGLFVAIPAAAAYNFFVNKISEYDEYHNILIQQLIYLAQKDQ
ncbi:MAG: MotA/TolQ/ExbB proton channel family protein [Alphaproteobacteria bacterium]|jgi:biopolymer transport protein TolQ|nr:MotA/TolQ/ExbB proton channel family protein [Alphaproteobacteria bacterium]